MEQLRRILESYDVVPIPDKTIEIKYLTQCRESLDRDTVCGHARYVALMQYFVAGLTSIVSDMETIATLGSACAKIKRNTAVLSKNALEFAEPLSKHDYEGLLHLRACASQVLSEEAPTAAYLVYSGQPHYVAIARSFRDSIIQTTNVLILLNRFVQLVDCETPDAMLLDILSTEIALLPLPQLTTTTRNGQLSNRLLMQVLTSLSDDSRVGAPVDRWIHFDSTIELPALADDLVPHLQKWSSTMARCIDDIERHRLKSFTHTKQELILQISKDLAARLACCVTLIAAQRMMCTHLHNLVLSQFIVTGDYYVKLVGELQRFVVDAQAVLRKVPETIAALEA